MTPPQKMAILFRCFMLRRMNVDEDGPKFWKLLKEVDKTCEDDLSLLLNKSEAFGNLDHSLSVVRRSHRETAMQNLIESLQILQYRNSQYLLKISPL
jgi:hypothetical protein